MATVNAASMMQTANLATTATATNVSPTSTVRMGALRCPTTRRASVLIRAAGNPERIDNFVEGAKSDASKNARNFGNTVAEKVGDVERTIKDVGRDMGAKSQEAVDAASQKVDETGDKANQVGDEVKTSTNNTLDAATETRSDQSVVVSKSPSPSPSPCTCSASVQLPIQENVLIVGVWCFLSLIW